MRALKIAVKTAIMSIVCKAIASWANQLVIAMGQGVQTPSEPLQLIQLMFTIAAGMIARVAGLLGSALQGLAFLIGLVVAGFFVAGVVDLLFDGAATSARHSTNRKKVEGSRA